MEALRPSDPVVVGRYRILARLGTGGMGLVYLATDRGGNRVALKLVRAELADDPSFRARFRREVDAGRRVWGDRTARTLDADVDSDRPYLVTEYVEGGNLRDHVEAFGPLTGERLLDFATGLTEALVAMDAVGVVHRDLKPSNVLMGWTGPKVVDFGISRAVDAAGVTQTGEVIGSPGWMAPELVLGRRATSAADVFSWGTTVAFAGTGRVPFGEGPSDAVLYRVIHAEPDLSGLDPVLREIVARCLEKEAARRPTPSQLLSVLTGRRNAAGGLLTFAPASRPAGRESGITSGARTVPLMVEPFTRTRPSRHRFTVVALLLLASGLIAGAVLLFIRADTRGRAAPAVAVRRDRQDSASSKETTSVGPLDAREETALCRGLHRPHGPPLPGGGSTPDPLEFRIGESQSQALRADHARLANSLRGKRSFGCSPLDEEHRRLRPPARSVRHPRRPVGDQVEVGEFCNCSVMGIHIRVIGPSCQKFTNWPSGLVEGVGYGSVHVSRAGVGLSGTGARSDSGRDRSDHVVDPYAETREGSLVGGISEAEGPAVLSDQNVPLAVR